MTSRQTRLATACQQLLALAAVVALLLPAANVVSLDVIGESPSSSPTAPSAPSGSVTADPAEADKVSAAEPATDASQSSTVAAAPTNAEVVEYDLTAAGVDGAQRGTSSEDASETEAPRGTLGRSAGEAEPSTPPTPDAVQTAGTQTLHPAEQEAGEATAEQLADGRTQLTAAPQDVNDFGTVGVTWDAGQEVADDAIAVQVRTQTDGVWTDWSDLDYHDEHGPDAGTAEAEAIRPGTDPLVVGRVDQVQVRTQSQGATPDGLRLAVVEADDADAPTAVEAPAIDTATLPTPDSATEAEGAELGEGAALTEEDVRVDGNDGEDALSLQAAVINKAKQPVIYSRAQWGANEKIRDASSLRYGSIQGAFVHHTVNGNDYNREDVPGILRSIYSYHVKSRGWSDIGYNFLVDKFGRIWEGRYGGVTKAVVGAHTLNYNDYSFAASAIGNYDTAKPSEATVNAYAALFAWKLGANKVAAGAGRTKIGRTTFSHAINGHRDAASTACPGRYLYARIGDIRARAAALQAGGNTGGGNTGGGNTGGGTVNNGTNLGAGPWTGASIRSTISNATYPDLVVVRSSDRRAMVVPTGGLTNFIAPRTLSSSGWSVRTSVQITPDLTGDRVADLVFVDRYGNLQLRKGNGRGGFIHVGRAIRTFAGYRDPRVAGDLTGDGKADLLARSKTNGRLYLFPGTGQGTFGAGKRFAAVTAGYSSVYPAGDVNRDGKGDLLVFKGGTMYLRTGNGDGSFRGLRQLSGSWGGYRDFVTGVDFTRDGRPDLLARNAAGRISIFPGRGDGTFGSAYGPTVRAIPALKMISSAGSVIGGSGADLVARKGDRLVVVPNAETYELGTPIDTGRTFPNANVVVQAGDWDLDGRGDVLTRSAAGGALYVWRGLGGGKLAAGVRIAPGGTFKSATGITVIGDVTGDRYPDLVATVGGKTLIYPGQGMRSLKTPIPAPVGAIMKLPVNTSGYDWLAPVANLTKASTRADVVARERGTGRVYVLEGATGYTTRRLLTESLGGYILS